MRQKSWLIGGILFAAIASAVVLAGCGLVSSFTITISPNPLPIYANDTMVPVTLKVTAGGMGSLTITEVKADFYTSSGTNVTSKSKIIDPAFVFPAIISLSREEKVDIPFDNRTYQMLYDAGVTKAVFTVVGNPKSATFELQVQLKDGSRPK
ncbi:MAG: hypothetical protein M1379_14080 [Firmicutes bacterium]|nr:hypothetical protein [Bacillota bacterium]